jgi:hypothetical protein
MSWRSGGERVCGGRGMREVQRRAQRARCSSIARQSPGGVLTDGTAIALSSRSARYLGRPMVARDQGDDE